MTNETRELWTTGRRGCTACVTAVISETSIVAIGDVERLTRNMMKRALSREFPRHTFYLNRPDSEDEIRASADRWTDDGV
jgi:hypothetical protein